VDQIAEIVAEAGEGANFRGHDNSVIKTFSPIGYQEIWR
jgi:hypothetical protein